MDPLPYPPAQNALREDQRRSDIAQGRKRQRAGSSNTRNAVDASKRVTTRRLATPPFDIHWQDERIGGLLMSLE
jgi:hypothetical protein